MKCKANEQPKSPIEIVISDVNKIPIKPYLGTLTVVGKPSICDLLKILDHDVIIFTLVYDSLSMEEIIMERTVLVMISLY